MTPVTRTLSFFTKWSSEIARQPALMLLLVVGPFLVLFAFGRGVELGGPKPRTIVVRTGNVDQPIDPLPEELGRHIDLIGETDDREAARADLVAGRADAVLIVPRDPLLFIEQGMHIPLQVLIGEIDPVRASYARAFLGDQVAELNQATITKAIVEARASIDEVDPLLDEAASYLDALEAARGDVGEVEQQLAGLRQTLGVLTDRASSIAAAADTAAALIPGLRDEVAPVEDLQRQLEDLDALVVDLARNVGQAPDGLPSNADIAAIRASLEELRVLVDDLEATPAEVLSAPFVLELQQATPADVTFAKFYAPAVLALLIQHLSLSIAALSMSRARLLGIVDLFRVAPVRASEVVIGHYISYGALALLAGGLLLGLMVAVLQVPVFGSWALVAATMLALTASSLGIGFVTSLLTRSDQQATQVAMLVLLASIFFSGFAFSLDRITWPARALSYLLPSTYGIRALQDLMLRGVLREQADLVVMLVAGVALFVATILLYRREAAAR